MLLKDKMASLEENVYLLNTEITALRSFITEQLLVIKKQRKKHHHSIHHYLNQIDSETK